MIKMIFYTLLTYYPHIDRANVVLTAMIIYTMLYIGLSAVEQIPDDWKTMAITSVAIMDFTLLYGQYAVKYISDGKLNLKLNLNYLGFGSAAPKKKKSHCKKKKHHKKQRRVRFAKVNQYHEYQDFNPSWGMDRMSSIPTRGMGMDTGMGMGRGMDMGMGEPSWQLTPQQQLQKNLWKQYQDQMSAAAAMPMIDNRHMKVKDDDNFFKSDDESVNSDVSSDLSNSEEGFDF